MFRILILNIFLCAIKSGHSIRSTSFFNHVQRIFFYCAKKKMVWINTFRNIAFVTDYFSFRNFPIIKFPNPSSSNYSSSGIICSGTNPKSSISMTCNSFNWSRFKPNPATAVSCEKTTIETRNVCFSFSNHTQQYNRSFSHAQ